MKALSEKSRDELLKESRLLYQKLNREARAISKSKQPLLRDAYNRFQQLKEDIDYNQLSNYSDLMVKNIYRDLKYIESLKSSTLEGAIEAAQTFGDTKRFLDSLSPQKREEFWGIYNRAYKNLRPDLIERFRYNIFGVLTNEMVLGQDSEEIFAQIKEAFDEAYESGKSEEEQGEIFAEKLELLFSDAFEEIFDLYL